MHRMYDLSGAGEGAGGGGGGASPAKNIDQLDGGGGIGGEEIHGKGGGIRGGGGEIRGKRGGIGAGSSDPSQPKVAARLSQLLFRSMQGCVSDVSPMQAPSPGWQSVASGHTAPPPTWASVSVQARSFAASHSAVHSDQDPSQSASLWANEPRFVVRTQHQRVFSVLPWRTRYLGDNIDISFRQLSKRRSDQIRFFSLCPGAGRIRTGRERWQS